MCVMVAHASALLACVPSPPLLFFARLAYPFVCVDPLVACRCLITAHPIPPAELRWEAWLRSPLFACGLDRGLLEVRGSVAEEAGEPTKVRTPTHVGVSR
jgi:hypothetical protein